MTIDLHAPSRVLPLEGGVNFRDLGGYLTEDQRSVSWRKIFRCGHLGELTDRDLESLEQLNVTHVHDFRREEEQKRTPSQPVRATIYNDYEMHVGSMSKFWEYMSSERLTAESAHALVVGSYRDCVDDVAPHYARLFASLLSPETGASVFHCSAGKDRTGMAAALILSALGVDRDTVIEDYLLTLEHFDSERLMNIVEQHLRDANVAHWERSWLVPYCSVHRDNIEAFFEGVESRYSNVNNYLAEAIGVNAAQRETLKALYLDD